MGAMLLFLICYGWRGCNPIAVMAAPHWSEGDGCSLPQRPLFDAGRCGRVRFSTDNATRCFVEQSDGSLRMARMLQPLGTLTD